MGDTFVHLGRAYKPEPTCFNNPLTWIHFLCPSRAPIMSHYLPFSFILLSRLVSTFKRCITVLSFFLFFLLPHQKGWKALFLSMARRWRMGSWSQHKLKIGNTSKVFFRNKIRAQVAHVEMVAGNFYCTAKKDTPQHIQTYNIFFL